MPSAPRPHGKARKIWLRILGTPFMHKKTDHEKKLDKRLSAEEIGRNRKN